MNVPVGVVTVPVAADVSVDPDKVYLLNAIELALVS